MSCQELGDYIDALAASAKASWLHSQVWSAAACKVRALQCALGADKLADAAAIQVVPLQLPAALEPLAC